jgi:hypothetical protein
LGKAKVGVATLALESRYKSVVFVHGTPKYCGCCQPTTNTQTTTKQYKSERGEASTIEQYGPSLPLGLVIMYVASFVCILMNIIQ